MTKIKPIQFITGAILALISTNVVAKTPYTEVLQEYEISNLNASKMDAIAEKFEIISKQNNTYHVLVPSEKKEVFLNIDKNALLISTNIHKQKMDAYYLNPQYFSKYHSYPEVQNYIKDMVAKYPNLVTQVNIGETDTGQPIVGFRVFNSQNLNITPKEIIIDAATHGDEIVTTEVLLALAQELVDGYSTNSRFSTIINNIAITFIPVVNPDGFVKHQRYCATGTDPNRDYPSPETPNRTPKCKNIKNLISFIDSGMFVGDLTLHASGKLIMYPWSYTTKPITDAVKREEMSTLTEQMALENQYTHGQISTTIYVAKNSSVDYYYYKKNILGIAAEIGNEKMPKEQDLEAIVNETRTMVLKYIEHFLP